jgi:hypothetical protein
MIAIMSDEYSKYYTEPVLFLRRCGKQRRISGKFALQEKAEKKLKFWQS